VYLPLLPLEALRPCWCEPGEYALIDEDRAIVITPYAAAAGVEYDMRRGGIATVAPQTTMLDRQPAKEVIARDALMLALLQFSPEVAQAGEASAILDVTASLRLFGGHAALCRQIKAVVGKLGFTVSLGAGPTALGAWMLAVARPGRRQRLRRRTVKAASLFRQLDRLSCRLLPSSARYEEWFTSIGCDTLGKLRNLPRAGLQRRTSKALLAELDRAYGALPDLFEWVVPPPVFHVRADLMERIEHSEALLFDANRFILQLIGWLTVRRLAVTRFVLGMEHERGRAAVPPTVVEISLAEPTWREDHLMRLLKERLGRITLSAPVIALSLEATQFHDMAPVTATLFPEPGSSPSDFAQLLELLIARLGKDNVLVYVRVADNRPEAANCWMPATDKRPKIDEVQESVTRPFWMLDPPVALIVRDNRPFYGSPLRIAEKPERIESGWWDGLTEARDYYVAYAPDGSCYWLFQERSNDPRWFLHGLFG